MDCYKSIAELLEEYEIFYKLALQKAAAEKEACFFQLPILSYIISHPGCTQIEVSKKLLLSPASIALSTRRLQKEGLIEKVIDEDSLRQNNLTATEKGRRLAESYEALRFSVQSKAFLGFEGEELHTLKGFLQRVTTNLSNGRSMPLGPEEKAAFSNKIKLEQKKKIGETN